MGAPFDMQAELQRRADKRASKCRHFNGTVNAKCKVGIEYVSVRVERPGEKPPTALPCYGVGFENKCDSCVKPTAEEAMAEVLADEAIWQKRIVGIKAAHEHAKASGLRKGRGGTGTLPCPVCGTGTIGYAVSSYNGHMHAGCTTKDCVAWVE